MMISKSTIAAAVAATSNTVKGASDDDIAGLMADLTRVFGRQSKGGRPAGEIIPSGKRAGKSEHQTIEIDFKGGTFHMRDFEMLTHVLKQHTDVVERGAGDFEVEISSNGRGISILIYLRDIY